MRINTLQFCVAGALLLAPSLVTASDVFGVKPGLWEMTTTNNMSGNPMPAMDLDKLPPAARARLEAAMGSRQGAGRSMTTKSCVTQQDLDQDRMIKQEGEKRCTRKVISKSSKSMVMEMTCPAPMAATSRMSMQAISSSSMAGTIDMTRPDGFKMHIDLKGRWLGADCGKVKE